MASSLDAFATEIRHLQRTEVREVEEPFAKGQKGSSAMPHKRNPVRLRERLRAGAGGARLRPGGLENVALWHERDISHSSVERVILPDASILCDFTAGQDDRRDRPSGGQCRSHGGQPRVDQRPCLSQRVLLSPVEPGLSRDDAYRIVQRNAMQAWEQGTRFRDLLDQDPDVQLIHHHPRSHLRHLGVPAERGGGVCVVGEGGAVASGSKQ